MTVAMIDWWANRSTFVSHSREKWNTQENSFHSLSSSNSLSYKLHNHSQLYSYSSPLFLGDLLKFPFLPRIQLFGSFSILHFRAYYLPLPSHKHSLLTHHLLDVMTRTDSSKSRFLSVPTVISPFPLDYSPPFPSQNRGDCLKAVKEYYSFL